MVKDVESQRYRSEVNLNNISKTFEKTTPEDKISSYYQQKLKNLYNSAIADAQQEEEILRKALGKINDVRSIRNERRIQVKYKDPVVVVHLPEQKFS